MVNLLPDDAQRKLAILYYARLSASAVFLLAFAVAAGAALLVPSYLLATAEADAAARSLSASQKTSSADDAASQTLPALSERVSILKAYPRTAAVAGILSALTRALPASVVLNKTAMTFGGNADAGGGTVSVSGTAGTRDALIAYAALLRGSALFGGIEVPVSELVAHTDIPFTLSFPLASKKP